MKRLEDAAEAMAHRLRNAGRLTVLTGAGISAESGVPTFRDTGGVWQQVRLEDVATPEAFVRNPATVLEFYNTRRKQLFEVEPNPAHRALCELERLLSERMVLLTQNIDNLHERGGSQRVLHMHGELCKARCVSCHQISECLTDIVLGDCCACGGQLRPHVVWFGELPLFMDHEIPEALTADVFLSVGTSGAVYPAAGFVAAAKSQGALTVELNLEPADNTTAFDVHLRGRAGELLPRLQSRIAQLL